MNKKNKEKINGAPAVWAYREDGDDGWDVALNKTLPQNSDETLTNDIRNGACLVTADEEAEEAHHHYSTVGHLNREQTRPTTTREKVNIQDQQSNKRQPGSVAKVRKHKPDIRCLDYFLYDVMVESVRLIL